MTDNILTFIVKRALLHTVPDIGQLTEDEKKELKRAVKHGVLDKGKGGPYPLPKTVYACKGFDFKADREAHWERLRAIAHFDAMRLRGVL